MKIKYYRWLMAIALGLGMSAYSVSTQRPINHATLRAMPTASFAPRSKSFRAIAADNAEAERTLLIWKIGDPGKESLPDTDIPGDIRQRAEELDYKIDVEAVSAKSVTAKLRAAIRQNREPDIITYRDRGVLEGTETDSEKLAGIYSIDGVQKSLILVNDTLRSLKANALLLNTSINHSVARQLALPELECGNTAETQLIGNVDRDAIEKLALNYAQAFFSKSKTEFRNYLSKSAIVRPKPGDMKAMPSEDIEICSIVANDNLAAVSTAVAHDGDGAVGHIDLLMVLHKENNNWRLLTQQFGSNENFKPYINKLANAIADSSPNTSRPSPASDLAPEDIRPKLGEGARFGEFTWQPSQSDNVVAEIAEFSPVTPGINARLFVKFRDDRISVEDSISAGEISRIYDSNKGETWRWRVWSIAADGSVAFSETKTF